MAISRLSIEDLTSPEAVLQAVAEFDRLGREEFLTTYGFGPARGYFLRHEGRLYDSKAIAGVAVGIQHPEHGPLRPAEFSGGQATVKARLEQLGFEVVVNPARAAGTARAWWVNQGATYEQESRGGYLWAPQRNKAGFAVAHHMNMTELRAGDVVLHYAKGSVRAVGQVREPAREATRPSELPTEQWAQEGYLANLAYHEAPSAITLEEIPSEWRIAEGGPFTRHGAVKQGYLFPLSAQFIHRFAREFGARWPELAPLVAEVGEDAAVVDEFVQWAKRFRSWPEFEAVELAYKREIAAVLAGAAAALRAGEERWVDEVQQSFRTADNNLLPWQLAGRLSNWVRDDPTAEQAFAELWGQGDPIDRGRAFLAVLPTEVVSGRGTRTAVVSYFLMAEDADSHPIYRPTAFQTIFDLADYPPPDPDADEIEVYEHALTFLDDFAARADEAGLPVSSRLEAQSLAWSVAMWPVDKPRSANGPPLTVQLY